MEEVAKVWAKEGSKYDVTDRGMLRNDVRLGRGGIWVESGLWMGV